MDLVPPVVDGRSSGQVPVCPACGAAPAPGAQFCAGCGGPLPAAADGRLGWYANLNGESGGPYEWEAVVGLVRKEGTSPILLWHPSLGAWTPAARLPAFRRSLRRWLLPTVGIIVVVALGAGLLLGPGRQLGVPVADTHMVSADQDSLAGQTSSITIVPGKGGALSADGVEVRVPPAAVVAPTTITLTRVSGPYESPFQPDGTPAPAAEGGAPTAWALSPVFDLGPAGTEFREPVGISIRYDESALPEGMSESQVRVAYFNGENWVPVPALVDQAANTATVALERFDGIRIVVIVAVALVLGFLANRAVHWWYGPEGVKSDPISEGKAAEWVVPQDPVVVGWAGAAVAVPDDTKDIGARVPLSDKANVEKWAASGRRFTLSFIRSNGEQIRLAPRSTIAPFTNWQKPADYFVKNDFYGDCTDVTNASVSVLRNLGYEAKGVFGYQVGEGERTPHVWAEVIVGGKPFLLDEGGMFWPLDEGMEVLKVVRAGPEDPRNAMWDETKQERYRERWWEKGPAQSPSPTPAPMSPSPAPFEDGQVPIEPGWELAATVQASDPSDPGDRRLYVTITHAYEFEDRNAVTIAVFEYLYVNGKLGANPSGRIFFTDVAVNSGASGDPVAEALARAAEWTAGYIAEQGLKADLPQ